MTLPVIDVDVELDSTEDLEYCHVHCAPCYFEDGVKLTICGTFKLVPCFYEVKTTKELLNSRCSCGKSYCVDCLSIAVCFVCGAKFE